MTEKKVEELKHLQSGASMKLGTILLFAISITLVTLAGCEKGGEEKSSSGKAAEDDDDDDVIDPGSECSSLKLVQDVTYESTVGKVLEKNCLSCHSGTNDPELDTYSKVKSNATKIMATLVPGAETPMPPGGKLDSEDLDAIQAWVDAGMPEGTANDGGSGTTEDDHEGHDHEEGEHDHAEDCATTGGTTGDDFGNDEHDHDGDGTQDHTDSEHGDDHDHDGDGTEDHDADGHGAGENDVEFAAELWTALKDKSLVGEGRNGGQVYNGFSPHGTIVEYTNGNAKVDNYTGEVHVKHNYGGTGVTVAKVNADKDKWTKAITVIYQREGGYDPENDDWYWVKFMPDGTLHKDEADKPMAGKLESCISCHAKAGGSDYLWKND
jgi:hypothetical protein